MRNDHGFGLLDIVIAITLMALIASIGSSLYVPEHKYNLEKLAEKVQSDLELTRMLAISRNKEYKCVFTPHNSTFPNAYYPLANANNYYYIYGSGEVFTDPGSSQQMRFNFNHERALPYAQLTFPATREIIFTRLGYLSPASSSEIYLTKAGFTYEVKASPTSGLISVQNTN